MTNKSRIWAGLWIAAFAVTVVAIQPVLSTGCEGCRKEEEPAPAQKAAPVQKVEEKAPPAPKVEAPAVTPITLDVLKLMPESAMMALALPPVAGLQGKGVALAKRIAPEEVDIDAEIAKHVAQMAQDAGVPDAKSLPDIMRAKGWDPDAPVAVFADLTASAADAKAALGAMQSMMDATTGSSSEAEAGQGQPAGAASLAQAQGMAQVFSNMELPAMAGVIGCVDAKLAEDSLKELLSMEGGPIDASKVEDIEAGGVSIHCYGEGEFAYFVAGDKLVLGNSLAMLKETAARLDAPAAIRYGSAGCPATVADEAVAVLRADKIMPLLVDLMPAWMAMSPMGASFAKVQMEAMNEMVAAFSGEDPLVITLAWTDEMIELLSRIDLAKHPDLAAFSGGAQPLRLAPLVPEGALLMLSVRFNDETKKRIKETYVDGLPPDLQGSEGVEEIMKQVDKALGVLGDELTIAVAAGAGLPSLFIMAGLADPEKAKSIIEELAPIQPGETYEGVDIGTLAVPAPLPVYLAFPADTLVISNDVEKLKGIIDNLKSGEISNLFASLDPPLDPATPRYSAFLISSKLLTDVVIPLSGLAGGIPPAAQDRINIVTNVLKEVRVLKEQKGNWAEGRLTLSLN